MLTLPPSVRLRRVLALSTATAVCALTATVVPAHAGPARYAIHL